MGVTAHTATALPLVGEGLNRPRHVDPNAGRALEILGHAIEYLTDEFVHEGGDLTASDPRLEAVQLLMAVNRRVYFDCPVIPSMSERLWAYLRGVPVHP